MKAYFQGVKGAYSHKVGLNISKKFNITELIGVESFENIFENVVKKKGLGIIPIKNNYTGFITDNINKIKKCNIEVLEEYTLKVSHCLASTSDKLSTVRTVYSHYQALLQCKNYLEKNSMKPIIFDDTALAAKYVKQQNNKKIGAICSDTAAKIYGLNILDTEINDIKDNKTTFVIIKRK